MRLTTVLYLVVFSGVPWVLAEDAAPDGMAIASPQVPAFESRKQLRSGRVRIRINSISYHYPEAEEAISTERYRTMEIVFQGDSWRVDTEDPFLEVRMPNGKSSNRDDSGNFWIERVFRTPEDSGSYCPGTLDDAPEVAKYGTGPPDESINRSIFDPRLIGISSGPVSVMRSVSLLSPIRGEPYQFAAPEPDVHLSEPCMRVHGVREQGRHEHIYWFAPNRGGEVIRTRVHQIEGRQATFSYAADAVLQLKEWQPGIWFPEERILDMYINGRLDERETITVLNAEFNIEIPQAEFSMAGLKLPVNWIMAQTSPDPKQVAHGFWNGNEVVPFPTVAADGQGESLGDGREEQHRISWQRMTYLVVNILGLVLIALYFWRSRPHQTNR